MEEHMLKNMISMLRNDDGATMVEYGIMVALIAAVCIVLISTLGRGVSSAFSTVNGDI
jgi:pilus assembly protein Flp/PilA